MEQALTDQRRDYSELRQAIDELTMEVRQQFEGRNGLPGIITRIDRLEQIEMRRSKVVWLTFGTSLAAILTALWERVFGPK